MMAVLVTGPPQNITRRVRYGSLVDVTAPGRLYVFDGSNWVPIAGDDVSTTNWANREIGVALGASSAAGFAVEGVVALTTALVSGSPAVGDPLYVAEAAGVGADKGLWTSTAPSDSGDVVRIVAYVQDVLSSGYRVRLTPDKPALEIA